MENLNLDQNGRPRWTLKTLFIGKPWAVIGSIVVYHCLFHIAFRLLTILPLPRFLEMFIYRHSWLVSLLIAIPIGIHMQIKRANLSLDGMTPEEAVHTYEMERKFKWYPGYGYLIGFLLFFIMAAAVILGAPLVTGDSEIASRSPVVMLLVFVTMVLAIGFTIWFNRFMLQKTQTNHQLLDELSQGLHWDEIPEEFLTDENKQKVIKRLKKGRIHSMEEAVISLKSDKASKTAMKVGGIIGIVIGLLGLSLMNRMSKEVETCAREMSEEITRKPAPAPDPGPDTSGDEEWRRLQKKKAKKMYYTERDRARTSAAYNDVGKTHEHINKMKYWKGKYEK